MDRKKVNSNKFLSVGYDLSSQILEIEFRGGNINQYARVSSEVYRRLMNAPTMESFFRDNIEEEHTVSRIR